MTTLAKRFPEIALNDFAIQFNSAEGKTEIEFSSIVCKLRGIDFDKTSPLTGPYLQKKLWEKIKLTIHANGDEEIVYGDDFTENVKLFLISCYLQYDFGAKIYWRSLVRTPKWDIWNTLDDLQLQQCYNLKRSDEVDHILLPLLMGRLKSNRKLLSTSDNKLLIEMLNLSWDEERTLKNTLQGTSRRLNDALKEYQEETKVAVELTKKEMEVAKKENVTANETNNETTNPTAEETPNQTPSQRTNATNNDTANQTNKETPNRQTKNETTNDTTNDIVMGGQTL